MKVYIFMFIWVIGWGIISSIYSRQVCVGEINGVKQYENRSYLFFSILIFSVIILIAGLRSGVGDTPAYIKVFSEYPVTYEEAKSIILDPNARENGFRLFSILIKKFISDDFHIWLFIIATISGICIMIPLYKYSLSFSTSVFLFLATCQFTWMLNGMRQFLAASIAFACTPLILKDKKIPYILTIIILSSIHVSILIMIPAYFLVKSEPWSKKGIIFIFIIIMTLFFTNEFTSILNSVVEQTNYEASMEEFRDVDDGTSVIRIIVESVPVIIAFIYRDRIKEKLTPIIKISINMSLVATGLYIISKIARSGILLGRLPIYFSLYNLILLPWLLNNLFEKKERRLIYFNMVVCYFIFYYYQNVVAWGGFSYISDILNIKIYK